MSKIVNGSDLVLCESLSDLGTQGNVFLDIPNKLIFLKEYGLLSQHGVTINALYIFLKNSWKSDPELIKFYFPMDGVTPEQFELIHGWDIAEDSIKFIRDGGFAVKDQDGKSIKEYCSIITLGELGSNDQVYYSVDGSTAVNFILTGPVNQCIKILDTSINYVNKTTLELYVREYKKKYASTSLVDIGVFELAPKAYRFSLENQDDLKITHTDDQLLTGITYQGMQVKSDQTVARSIDNINYNFNTIIDVGGSFPQAEEIYEWVQWYLRQPENKLKPELLEFIGNSLQTKKGVFIDGFALSDINRLEFRDVDNIIRKYPFISTLTLLFNDVLVQDSGSTFAVFFTDNQETEFNNQNAIVVNDSNGAGIHGEITGPKLQFSFDYDNNTQGGRIPGSDTNITVVAMGLEKAQYISVEGNIQRSNNNSVLLNAGIERNYNV